MEPVVSSATNGAKGTIFRSWRRCVFSVLFPTQNTLPTPPAHLLLANPAGRESKTTRSGIPPPCNSKREPPLHHFEPGGYRVRHGIYPAACSTPSVKYLEQTRLQLSRANPSSAINAAYGSKINSSQTVADEKGVPQRHQTPIKH